jgi:hypothetical protein
MADVSHYEGLYESVAVTFCQTADGWTGRGDVQKEIEKVKKRREEREIERAQQEEELSMLARERAIAEGYEMEKKEEEVRAGHPPFSLSFSLCVCCMSVWG